MPAVGEKLGFAFVVRIVSGKPETPFETLVPRFTSKENFLGLVALDFVVSSAIAGGVRLVTGDKILGAVNKESKRIIANN